MKLVSFSRNGNATWGAVEVGDVVEVEISRIGLLRNVVALDPA